MIMAAPDYSIQFILFTPSPVVTRLRIDASSHGETANGAAASAKSELVTYAYYVRTFKYYPPAIYHGQGLARYGRMGSD